mgnify:CR=1 FL=1
MSMKSPAESTKRQKIPSGAPEGLPAGLWVVATPIGNLGDMTVRAIETLRGVDWIYAEDTRVISKLLARYEIQKPLQRLDAVTEVKKSQEIIARLEAGEHVALVSDAGTPGISDPGFLLARACQKEGIAIEVLPGATAFVPALVKSGFALHQFRFEGFLPQKKGRQTRILALAARASSSATKRP